MADLQDVIANDDALDDELQDGLLLRKRRCGQPLVDAISDGVQTV